ncbi:MAG: tetraacyldisaccharide 4'-kinase, partial [Gammaproteobacteria bacterium]|nr:tetraacyldisaccharide 4'-kinase [Gammaproteobacteria bacterium]
KPGVISRGYGGRSRHWPVSVTSDSSAAMVGDEPLLIHSRSGCPVVVGPNRKDDIEQLLSEYDCDLILSDDGLQHYRMGRSAEIAVIDASRGFGNGFCLPSGPLREPVSRLKTVDMCVVNGGSDDELSFQVEARQLNALFTETECYRLDQFKGQKVHAIAGIGNPERFFSLLEANGIECIRHPFPDHYAYQAQDVCFDDQLPVLMTEKDAVKCFPFKLDNHWYMPIDVRLSETAQQQFNHIIQQVCNG